MDDIVWTDEALNDLDDIGAYIALDDPNAAARTVVRIGEAVGGLGFFPRIGRPGRISDTRELVVANTPYIVIYRLRDRVEILAVIHGSQRWPDSI